MRNLVLEPNTVVTVLVVSAFIPSLLYTGFYFYRPWTTTPQGRALMVKSWANLILLGMALAYQLFGEYGIRPYVRAAGFSLLIVGVWYLLIAMLRTRGADAYPPYTWARRVRDLARRVLSR